ncbi:pentapeptide repeat protein [Beutenbergia cavernae DSM 12333]|uniref:Pentapeptide repeat protein n=1 Tax=Beutenbergia cavernae (strain ATCC BAA-8 / DSM 12333 / CCUG 43141 / JCM 11478 / NBRC 16432 / NCIMB 13614 / HKI 0122) TaxID=471853 RepID=C5C2K4_BEUC1|nr:pentapeptide repeat-containing protein [Beutenbergia cavernae]ACQ79690.1 pentapeptide repeat protein [Beutenbergia cavernae DSM 12333]
MPRGHPPLRAVADSLAPRPAAPAAVLAPARPDGDATLDGADLRRADLGTLDDVAILASRLDGVRAPGADWRGVNLTECTLDAVDLAGARLEDVGLAASSVADARLTGATWLRAAWRDVAVRGGVAATMTFAQSRLRRVRFEGVDASGLELIDTELTEVAFVDCDLRGARLGGARVRSDVVVVGCDLDGATGLAALRGAQLGHGDAVSGLASMAAELGIRIGDDLEVQR